MSKKKKDCVKIYDLIVYIGRMQPPTKAHIANVEKALSMSLNVAVLFGSSYQPRTIKNPWKWYERAAMLLNQLDPSVTARVSCNGIRDHLYNDNDWVQEVQSHVKKLVAGVDIPRIGIIGCKKDSSSYYLDLFPQWDFIEMDQIPDVNASALRELYFDVDMAQFLVSDHISDKLLAYLDKWRECKEYEQLCKEQSFIRTYQKGWEVAPYHPTFVTSDAVVIQSGHVLMVQRKATPGEGLWALPGGFVNPNERIEDGMLRELREETGLKIPVPVLKGSIKGQHVFDHPSRSLRGRTITHAFAIQLGSGDLSKVKGGDDAAKAKWFPISDVLEMSESIFEDHLSIINWALSL